LSNIRPGEGGISPAYLRGSGITLINDQGKVAATVLRAQTLDTEVAKLLLELK
jgi:hypothetical protein